MPHPWDFHFAPRGNSFRVIHDATKHPGDGIWPTNTALKKRILRGDELICLSESVSSKVERLGVSVHRCKHPTFLFGEKEAVFRDPNSVLFIGRQRKYKGGDLLANSWPRVLEKLPSAKLIVAGEGLVNQTFFKLKNVKILNYWLSEYEISELLQSSSVAVFPYIEASQSGLIASADLYGTKIVSTAVGGLIEQTIFFGGTLVEELNPDTLADKIVESLTSQKNIAVNETRSSSDMDLYNFVCSLAK
jgi:glycosyltransferase involved in cell wall biosynthesis